MLEILPESPESLPTADLSIEVWHAYAREFHNPGQLEAMFKSAKYLVSVCTNVAKQKDPAATVSTVFLFDDANIRSSTKPYKYLEKIQDASQAAGIEIDYVAREKSFAKWGNAVIDTLQEKQIKDSFKVRRSPMGVADLRPHGYGPSCKHTGSDHAECGLEISVPLYMDSINKKGYAAREWSCPLLASLWQLERLGRLSEPMTPVDVSEQLPIQKRWHELPEVMQLNPDAAPFHAKEIMSILPNSFMNVEAFGVASIHKILARRKELPISYSFSGMRHDW